MKMAANRIHMPTDFLKDAIVKGLKQHLRVAVLQANVTNIQELLTVARTTENAYTDDTNNSAQLDVLTAN
jgi:hypothetical protein